MTRKKKLPDFKKMSDMEIAKFWDKHDAAEFWPELKEEKEPFCRHAGAVAPDSGD